MRYFLILTFFVFCALPSIGQVKLGLKLSPSISSNRILSDDENFEIDDNGVEMRFKFGLETDFLIGDNYAFSTGIFYAPKRFSFSGDNTATNTSFLEEYKLQYLEIPATIKLFTSEIQPDLGLYFQTGGLIDIKVFEDNVSDNADVEIRNFKPFDIAFVFGTGVEYKIGANTIVMAGISYERGLVNVIGKTTNLPEDITGRNDLLSLNLGIRF